MISTSTHRTVLQAMSSKYLSALERLPYEILLSIHDVLDDVSATCLKYTSSNMRSELNRDPTLFSRCTKWLIMCRFEWDIIRDVIFGRSREVKLSCAFCKAKRTWAQIEGRKSNPSGVSFQICDPYRVCLHPEARYCAKHPLFITWVESSPLEPEASRWVVTPRLTCTHCRARVQSADTRSTGCDHCKCDVCPRDNMPHFIRYGKLPKAARGGRPYIDGLITRDDRRTAYVSEVGSKSPSQLQSCSISNKHVKNSSQPKRSLSATRRNTSPLLVASLSMLGTCHASRPGSGRIRNVQNYTQL